MKQFNRKKGSKGEDIASGHLAQKGFQIVERNAATKFGEIDIIAIDREVLVFVEVKLKVGADFGSPEEMINMGKLRQIRRTAEMYLLANKELSANHDQKRIDAVAIVMRKDGEVERISHYQNVAP